MRAFRLPSGSEQSCEASNRCNPFVPWLNRFAPPELLASYVRPMYIGSFLPSSAPLYCRCPFSSPPRSSPTMEARAGPAGGQGAPGVTRNGGGNTRDARDQELTSNGIRGNGKGKEAERGDDNGGGSDRARRGGGRAESVASSTGANGDASGATAAVAREREGAGGASRSGGTPERGTKRLSEVELEAAAVALAGGSGAGERGAGGRPRGKMPRGRSHSSQTSSAAPGASSLASAAPAAVAVEGRGAGSSGRRRGRSPM